MSGASSDPLDRLLAFAEYVDADMYESQAGDDIRALVEIARAARAYVHSEDADDAAIGELLDEIEPNRQEALLDVQKTARRQADEYFEALRAALARLITHD